MKCIQLIVVSVVLISQSTFAQQLVPFLKGKEWRVYNKGARTFIDGKYESVIPSKCNVLFIKRNGMWGAIDQHNKQIIPINYLSLVQVNNTVFAAKDKNGIVLLDTAGNNVVKEKFLEVSAFKNNPALIVVRNEKMKYGIITGAGKYVLNPEYDFAPEHMNKGYLRVSKRNKDGSASFGLLDSTFEFVFPLKYESIEVLNDGHFRCTDARNSNILFSADLKVMYDGPYTAYPFTDDFLHITDNAGERSGYYFRKSGKIVFNEESKSVRLLKEKSKLMVYSDDESGITIYNSAGDKTVIPGVYLRFADDNLEYFVIADNKESGKGLNGIADYNGKIHVPCTIKNIHMCNDQHFSVGVDDKDEKGRRIMKFELYAIEGGRKVSPVIYEGIELFNEGGVALRQNGTWRLYNSKLQPWDNIAYSNVSRGQRLVSRNNSLQYYEVRRSDGTYYGMRGFINGECKPVIPCIYRDVRLIEGNYRDSKPSVRICATWYEAEEGNPYGIIHGVMLDRYGRNIPVPECSGLGYDMGGLITITRTIKYEDELRGLTGLIDTSGNLILPMEYDEIQSMGQGQGFRCKRNGITMYADVHGKIIPTPGYSFQSVLTENYFIGTQHYKRGVLNKSGQTVTAFRYDEIRYEVYLNGTLFAVKKDNVEFYADNQGNEFYSPN